MRGIDYLRSVEDAIDQVRACVEQPDGSAVGGKPEIHVRGSFLRIAVGDENVMAAGAHKSQRRHRVTSRPAERFVGQVQPAKVHGLRGWIEHLDEIIHEQALPVGEPFVDSERAWVPEARRIVRAGRRRVRERPGAVAVAAN